jgi:hypothetical protein
MEHMSMHRVAIAAVLLAAGLPLFAQQGVDRYTETHGSRSYTVELRTTKTPDGTEITSTGNGVLDTVRWVTGTGTAAWHQVKADEGTDFTVERSGAVLRVTGTFKGKTVSREIKVDAAPWYQLFGPLIAELLPAGSTVREFWVVDRADFTAHRMMVKRVGTDRIPFHGATVEALKVHFSPAGALAPFWGADFWLRPSDSAWIYSKLPDNGVLTVATLDGAGN